VLYMVELDFADPAQSSEWNAWYSTHLVKLLDMPGFRTAQRFRAVTPCDSPFLALYQVDSPAVFTSPEYLARGGPRSPGSWAKLMINWHRNLFAGVDSAPDLGVHQQLVVVDRESADSPPLPEGLRCLESVGLDRSVVERGIAVCDPESARRLWSIAGTTHTRIFEPMGAKLQTPAG
jgi:hypothetical protein